jgi:type IV pilus assembly protein PilV
MTRIRAPHAQQGVMLLEALIAILIFSVGILAIVGMQASAMQDIGEARYRTQAAFMANRAIAQMWGAVGTDPTPAQIQARLATFNYGGGGGVPAAISDWVSSVQNNLPGSTTYPPMITVNANNSVVVTVRWRAARDASANAQPHSYRAVAYYSL